MHRLFHTMQLEASISFIVNGCHLLEKHHQLKHASFSACRHRPCHIRFAWLLTDTPPLVASVAASEFFRNVSILITAACTTLKQFFGLPQLPLHCFWAHIACMWNKLKALCATVPAPHYPWAVEWVRVAKPEVDWNSHLEMFYLHAQGGNLGFLALCIAHQLRDLLLQQALFPLQLQDCRGGCLACTLRRLSAHRGLCWPWNNWILQRTKLLKQNKELQQNPLEETKFQTLPWTMWTFIPRYSLKASKLYWKNAIAHHLYIIKWAIIFS